jgi:hypothetical protein
VPTGQATLGTCELDSGHDLLLGSVTAQPRLGRVLGGVRGEVGDPCLERRERGLQLVEAVALDARPGANGQGPGYRWSIGT